MVMPAGGHDDAADDWITGESESGHGRLASGSAVPHLRRGAFAHRSLTYAGGTRAPDGRVSCTPAGAYPCPPSALDSFGFEVTRRRCRPRTAVCGAVGSLEPAAGHAAGLCRELAAAGVAAVEEVRKARSADVARSRCRQRVRIGPMLPIGMPSTRLMWR